LDGLRSRIFLADFADFFFAGILFLSLLFVVALKTARAGLDRIGGFVSSTHSR
jgi:hypothetical protein